MSTVYQVSVDLKATGDLDSKLSGATSKVSGLSGALSKVGEGFTTVVEKAGAIAMHLGATAGGSALGAITYGVFSLNKHLETTKISLAAIFGAQGFSSSMTEGMQLSGDIMTKMRKDAAALPGEFSDLVSIYRTVATPGFQAGMDPDKLRDFSARTMATGAVMGLPMDVVAREMAMLLEGRAGAHNMLGLRLAGLGGDSAKAFNAKSAEDRLKFLNGELDKYKGSIEVFGHSFEGLWTSAVDNGKNLGRILTEGLFDKMKGTLEKVNAWFAENQLYLELWMRHFGEKLANAWDVGITKIQEWYPYIEAFAMNAYAKISAIWEKIQPYVDRFGNSLKEALADPGTIDKITYLLELYAGIKVGSALGGIGGIASIGKGIGSAASGAAGVGQTAMNLLNISGPELALVGVALAAVGAAAWQASLLWSEVSKDAAAGDIARREAGERVVESMKILDYTNMEYQSRMMALIDAGNELQASLLLAAGAAREFREMETEAHNKQAAQDDQYYLDRFTAGMPAALAKAQAEQEHKKTPKHPGGAGVYVNKVEISIAQNEDPSRVAYKVFDAMSNLKRNPRSSSFAPNYSASR